MKLRKMTMDDALLMLEWKNYPETRKYAIKSHAKVSKAAHLRWLPKNLKYFKIIEDGIQCGAVRVQDKEVSIWVDRALWGLGYAQEAVTAVSKRGSIAHIVDGNVASMRVFISCGYNVIGHKDNYYILRK